MCQCLSTMRISNMLVNVTDSDVSLDSILILFPSNDNMPPSRKVIISGTDKVVSDRLR